MLWRSLCALVVVSALGCAARPQASTCQKIESGFGPAGTVAVKTEVVANGLDVPWSLIFLGTDILVSERPGRIRLIRNGVLEPMPVASVPSVSGGESGLLGMAAHPSFSTNRWLYLYRTVERDGSRFNQVERWVVSADVKTATFEKVIFGDIAGAQFHDGGRIRFGPDGMLYVGTGDAREPDRSPNIDNPSGKILRLTPEGAAPSDNPKEGRAMFVSGIRNTQGFDWLSATELFVSDHGPSGELARSGQDEVTIARAGDDLGWPGVSGCDAKDGTVAPLMSWSKAAPPGGVAVYAGDKIPGWKGSVLMTSLGARHLHRFVLDAQKTRVDSHEVYFDGDPPGGHGRLRDIVLAPDGHLYVTTSNCDGRGTCPGTKDEVLRIVAQ